MPNTYDLYNASSSTAAIMPQQWYTTNTNTHPTNYTLTYAPEPVMMAAPPTPKKLTAMDWLRERIDEMCLVGREALA